MAKRPLDQMIGFVGAIIGIIFGAIGMLLHKIPGLGGTFTIPDSTTMLLFSLIGLFGAFIVTSRKKDGGLIMIVIGLAGIIALPSYITVVPFIILLVAGLIARF